MRPKTVLLHQKFVLRPDHHEMRAARKNVAKSSIAVFETTVSLPAAMISIGWRIARDSFGRERAMARKAAAVHATVGRAKRQRGLRLEDRRVRANAPDRSQNIADEGREAKRWFARRHVQAAETANPNTRTRGSRASNKRPRQARSTARSAPCGRTSDGRERGADQHVAPVEWPIANTGGGQSGSTISRMKVSRSLSYSAKSRT